MKEEFIREVASILSNARKALESRYNVREELLLQTRTAIRDCGIIISLIHKGDVNEALEKLKDVEETLNTINQYLNTYPELTYGDVLTAFQEYVEAVALLSIVRGDVSLLVDKMNKMNVPVISIVNGLADLIGELKRQTIESLLKDDIEQAKKYLKLMEDIYMLLYDFEYPRSLVHGLRQKIDIARRIIEDARRIILECKVASEIKSIVRLGSSAKLKES